jgi:hypothetical protein
VSVQDERELRQRLGGLLGDLEPRPAPVFAAMRQGRGIKVRRWIAVAAGVVIVAGGAAALPAVLHSAPAVPRPAGPLHYSVTVRPPGKGAPAGLIASGKQDGYPWAVRITRQGSQLVVGGLGVNGVGGLPSDAPSNGVTLESAGQSGKGGTTAFMGVVGPEVTKVVFVLPGGRVYSLTPVSYDRHRYIAIAVPYGVPVVRAATYHGSRELSYAVPFEGTTFVDWLAPGQPGPARFSQTIGAGVIDGRAWRFSAQYGPWGYCFAVPDGSQCGVPAPRTGIAATALVPMSCGYVSSTNSGPTANLVATGPAVRSVTIRLSGGATERLQTVDVRGARLLAFAVPTGQTVTGSTEFGAAGQVVAHDSAAGINYCR